MSSLLSRLRSTVFASNFLRSSKPRKENKATKTSRRRQEHNSIYTSEYEHLQPVCGDKNDGAWLCVHCGHQNLVKLQDGNHPFGNLTCARCNHIFGSKDVSTNVIGRDAMRDDFHPDHVFVPEGKTCGVICPGCGATHRGLQMPMQDVPSYTTFDLSAVYCHCDKRNSGEYKSCWYRFSIGSCRDWHDDRIGAEGRIAEERLESRLRDSCTSSSEENNRVFCQ